MMKVLWLSAGSGRYKSGDNCYNGGGWIASLQEVVEQEKSIELALAFLTHDKADEEKTVGGTRYYPIYTQAPGRWKKLRTYYGGYKKFDDEEYVEQIQQVIHDFQPDIVQLFGTENAMATILGKTEEPLVVHLQGLLAPYDNAFFPIGLNKSNFVFPITVNEWVLRNGYIFAKNSIHARGKREIHLFKRIRYVMGRTEWDYEVSHLLASQSQYFHVDEVMRPCFYEAAGSWKRNSERKAFVISSTISQTIYKGLDLILKTASLLEQHTDIEFEWRVVGVNPDAKYVKFFEKSVEMKTTKVRYMGVLNAEQLRDNLLDSDVYVHPSYIDNSPNSVCEAQLLGLPVIATGVGGVTSLIEHNVSGLIVPANAPYELAYWLKDLFLRPQLAESLGAEAAKVAKKRHDRNNIIKQLLSTYQAIIDAHTINLSTNDNMNTTHKLPCEGDNSHLGGGKSYLIQRTGKHDSVTLSTIRTCGVYKLAA